MSELLQFNINTNEIYEMLFENLTEGALKLRNMVTSTLEMHNNGKIALTWLRQRFYKECNANESDGAMLVKIGASIEGVEFSIFLNEKEDNLIKINLRSKHNLKVNEIAKQFGGGGHEKAAGFVIEDSFSNVKDLVFKRIIIPYSKIASY